MDMARRAGKAGTQTSDGLMVFFLKGGVRKKGWRAAHGGAHL